MSNVPCLRAFSESLCYLFSHSIFEFFEFGSLLFFTKKIDTDEAVPKQVWKDMVQLVPNPIHIVGGADVYQQWIPRILTLVSGVPTPEKKDLMNRALKDWQMNLKKVKYKEGECPYYAPSVQNMQLRSFFSKLRDMYDFRFTLSDFKKFRGSLGGAMKELYEARRKKWVSARKYVLICI